jgi:hypothetical protein
VGGSHRRTLSPPDPGRKFNVILQALPLPDRKGAIVLHPPNDDAQQDEAERARPSNPFYAHAKLGKTSLTWRLTARRLPSEHLPLDCRIKDR